MTMGGRCDVIKKITFELQITGEEGDVLNPTFTKKETNSLSNQN